MSDSRLLARDLLRWWRIRLTLEAPLAADDPHAPLMQKLRQMVTGSEGTLPAPLRERLGTGQAAPAEIADLVEKVRTKAWTVTDEDIQSLLDKGYSENALFELTIASALSAALKRLEAGLKALEEPCA